MILFDSYDIDEEKTFADYVFEQALPIVTPSGNSLDEIDVSTIGTGVPVKGNLYHGSKRDDLDELVPYSQSYKGGLGRGLYLAERLEAANYGRHVYRVPVDLKNPFRIEHRPVEADPQGDSVETIIDADLLDALKEKGIPFQDWYEKFAGFSAEYDRPFGADVSDAVEEDGTLPEAFIDWLEDQDKPQAQAIAKELAEFDTWYSSAIDTAMAEAKAKGDPALYQARMHTFTKERKARMDKINTAFLEELWDKWPANNIPMIASSIFTGESVAPFWFRLGDEVVGCFDSGDMESISPDVEAAGYDAIVVEGLRAHSSFLGHEVVVFEPQYPDQVDGQPIHREEE